MAIQIKFRDTAYKDMVAVGATSVARKDGWVIIISDGGDIAAMYPEDVIFGLEKVPDLPADTFTCV